MFYKVIDFITKQEVSPKNFIFTGDAGPWEIVMDIAAIKAKLDLATFKKLPISFKKYLPLLPLQSSPDFIALNEIATPLIKSKKLGPELGLDLYFKIEGKNPTGSFKDRGSILDVAMAQELGAKALIVASTGNMAASCACYAAAAQLPCYVLVPEGAPMSKLAQVLAYGGHIVQIKGTYTDAMQLAKTIALQMNFYLAGDYAPRVEGQKTAAFEICDQFILDPPDAVIVPMG
ncbi:MAG TPA: pyridoxal-phosphate dependent enzyme, partial [Gammaproteobacteria bacterium]|nr:pyridoxal-phosphate dependent enzyme [Gammaproteobacteria bacterium]